MSSVPVKTPRLPTAAKEFNVGMATIIEALASKGHVVANSPVTKLTEEQYDVLVALYAKNRDAKQKSDQIQLLKDAIPSPPVSVFLNEKAAEAPKPEKIGRLQSGVERSLHTISSGGYSFQTIFLDDECVKLCGLVAGSPARGIVSGFLEGDGSGFFRAEIHGLANRLVSIYGLPLLEHILGLPKLPFGRRRVQELASYRDINPRLRTLTVILGDGKPYKLTFKEPRLVQGGRSNTVATLSTLNGGKILGEISRQGTVTASERYRRPLLQLFFEKKDEGGYQLYADVEDGTCEICGRELTDPKSKRLGIGPDCRR